MIHIQHFTFNDFQTRCCVVWDDTLSCAFVDPGCSSPAEISELTSFVSKHDLKPACIMLTHGHFDHLLGVDFLREKWGVKFAMSGKDEFLLKSGSVSAELFGIRAEALPETIDIDMDGMEEISFGNTTLKVIPTPGHTPGHVSLYEPAMKVLFTGDTLFRESIGRTDLPGGDYSWIMRSIIENILPLGDDVKIYPGHGEASDIGHESMYNPFVVEVINNEVNYKN
jgi:glyoxylase-like metal-dependent hydrolase (beta-lactamase superfamily II)